MKITSALETSPFSLGTGDWGARENDEKSLDALYVAFRAAGGNTFDTAHCYAFWLDAEGASERALGELVRRHDKRENVVICGKGCHLSGGAQYPRPDFYMTPEVLERDLQQSLERLQTDYIDLYFLHRDDARVPVDEILDALNQHKSAGRIRHYAASNWRGERLNQAIEYSKRAGIAPFAASQILWNLGELTTPPAPDMCVMNETEMRWYQENKLPLFVYSPTANGYFSNGKTESYANEISAKRRERTLELAQKYDATPNQIALAFLMNHDFPTTPILGTHNLDHLHDALGAAKIALSPDEVSSLKNGEKS